MSLDAQRHAAQAAFEAGEAALQVGSLAGTPFTLEGLLALRPDAPEVEALIDSGLTGQVWRLHAGGRRWALKRKRARARVHNLDGHFSFLTEVQRRADFERLKAADAPRWAAIVDTPFACARAGLILSPWLPGRTVSDWDERRLRQALQLGAQLWLAGLFEWDWSAGNLLDDGEQLRLFDFGYCWPFDPRCQFNSAGSGSDQPLFHPAERLETRALSAWLLGQRDPLPAFRLIKEQALACYQALREQAARQGTQAPVLAWLDGLCARWAAGLAGELEALYWAESWRSHALDLDDDLRGRSCTPLTLRRADWLIDALQSHGPLLRRQGALFGADAVREPAALLDHYRACREQALQWQIEETA